MARTTLKYDSIASLVTNTTELSHSRICVVNIMSIIIAMDPAGPFFENLDPLIRVDPTDADYVDVMHTNGGSLLSASFGMVAPCG